VEDRKGLQRRMGRVVRILLREAGLPSAAMTRIAAQREDPFDVLVGTVISLRTKDEVTVEAARRLSAIAPGPEELARLAERRIQKAIYPAGFYRVKANALKRIARILLERHEGKVPATMEELLALPMVGRKTANLVLLLGHGIEALCVDTHVHRISNRLGFVATRMPDQTEAALRTTLPRKLWWDYNELLVSFGKRTCTPLSPRCSVCPVSGECPQVGVTRTR
jgi:endonuclease-3